MRAVLMLLLLAPIPSPAQQGPPRLMYIYRDSLKRGVDSAYRAISNDGAQICADLKCPNPYLGLESLTGHPHEAWWINTFAGEADTTRVVNAYAANRALTEALGAVTKRKEPLIGTPIKGYAVYRPDLSHRPEWSIAGARFILVTVTRRRRVPGGTVWEAEDSTLYVLRPVKTRQQAEFLARQHGARIFAIRPNWSMPAPEWVAADPVFWRLAPRPRARLSGVVFSSKRMADSKEWMTENLNLNAEGSYCYEDAEANCRRYGRLYTWEAAQRECHSLAGGWRLPTNEEWRQMAKHYGGVRDDSDDSGRAAYAALVIGGSSGFNALFGGGRVADDGRYARLEAHGFYWTATESDSGSAWFYNFGQARLLNRHPDGDKRRALSVRCVRE